LLRSSSLRISHSDDRSTRFRCRNAATPLAFRVVSLLSDSWVTFAFHLRFRIHGASVLSRFPPPVARELPAALGNHPRTFETRSVRLLSAIHASRLPFSISVLRGCVLVGVAPLCDNLPPGVMPARLCLALFVSAIRSGRFIPREGVQVSPSALSTAVKPKTPHRGAWVCCMVAT